MTATIMTTVKRVRIDVEVELGRALLDPAQHQVLDRIEADGAQAKGMPDRRMHVVCAERLEQAQDLHVLAPSRPARTCLHQPAKRRERIGQLPSGERRCLVQRSDLALNEGQIVERVAWWTPPPSRG